MQIYTLLGVLLLFMGLPISLVGFKIINPFRNDNNPEREFIFYKTCGTLMRFSGLVLVVISVYFILIQN